MLLRLPLALGLLLLSIGMGPCNPGKLQQFYTNIPGVVEPNTPGAPGVVASQKLVDLLGPDPDLNRVHYVRTYKNVPIARRQAIVILIPGFLGGATTFDPLARDLVRMSDGAVEVWAVDRRPNQLEDRLGLEHALEGVDAAGGDPGLVDTALFEGAQFYFSDFDAAPTGDFPNIALGDRDLNQNGVLDPQLPLEDDFGSVRSPILFTQDDGRPFASQWGVDLYMRDWKLLVDRARTLVGPEGLVIFGGHSQGTSWTARFAAYDFDPGPGVVAGYSLVDGLVLLEGGGLGPPSGTPPTKTEYLQTLTDLQTPGPGSPDVFLDELPGGFGLSLIDLGTVGQIAALAGVLRPDEPALIQRTSVFATSVFGLLLLAPSTNAAIGGFFLDDDYQPFAAFRATLGFSTNGGNFYTAATDNYTALTNPSELRTWRNFDDPTLEADSSCPLNARNVSPGCAFNFAANPNDDEVSDLFTFLRTQYEINNGFEWYFLDGRVSLDFSYGNDSSSLGDESLLAITQTANVNIPVLGIGGDNGLAPTEGSFDTYFDSIATGAADKVVCILPGYAHVDPLSAADNLSVPLMLDMIDALENGETLEDTLTCPGSGGPT